MDRIYGQDFIGLDNVVGFSNEVIFSLMFAMATKQEIAQFFRLALRLGLLQTAAVERWVDAVIAMEPVVAFPFTELAGASKRRATDIDDFPP